MKNERKNYIVPTILMIDLTDDIVLNNSTCYDPYDLFNKTGYDPFGEIR